MKSAIGLGATLTISLLVLVSLSAASGPPGTSDRSSHEALLNNGVVTGPGSVFPAGPDRDIDSEAGVASHQDAARVPFDNSGDINLNGIPYEIADAVTFSKYFVYGLDAFHIDLAAQTAQTDIDADGLTLSVGDLVSLIRIIQ